jgi:hypothetical protein
MTDSCVPLEIIARRANGELVDPDGWQRPPRDLRDEALEDLRQQLSSSRLNEARAWARVKLLEARLDYIREALVKR